MANNETRVESHNGGQKCHRVIENRFASNTTTGLARLNPHLLAWSASRNVLAGCPRMLQASFPHRSSSCAISKRKGARLNAGDVDRGGGRGNSGAKKHKSSNTNLLNTADHLLKNVDSQNPWRTIKFCAQVQPLLRSFLKGREPLVTIVSERCIAGRTWL